MRRTTPIACFLIAAAALAGCNDPLSSRLVPGSEAIVRKPRGPSGGDGVPGDRVFLHPADGLPVLVEAGTRVRVNSDDESSHRWAGNNDPAARDGDGVVDRRKASVRVMEGRYEGTTGRIARNFLTPIGR